MTAKANSHSSVIVVGRTPTRLSVGLAQRVADRMRDCGPAATGHPGALTVNTALHVAAPSMLGYERVEGKREATSVVSRHGGECSPERAGTATASVLARRAIIFPMPRPMSERQAWAQELDELPAQIAEHRRQLDATPAGDKVRRENLEWRIRRDRLRMAELQKRLTRTEAAEHG